MNKAELVEYFRTHPSAFKRGSSTVASNTHSTIEDVKIVRKIFSTEERKNCNKAKEDTFNYPTPKILILDIETAPIKAYVWRVWKENIRDEQVIADWFIICWSAKWLYAPETKGECLTPEEIQKEDDSRIIKLLWKLLDEADIVVAHNGLGFDLPRINSRFIINGMQPPSSYKVIDTLQIAKKQFGFTHNNLDALASKFGIASKLKTEFSLWENCLYGDPKSLKYMLKYNKRDVDILEDLYLVLRPWIKNHPNVGNYADTTQPLCSSCGSHKVELLPNKYYYTSVGKYMLYRCKECGALSRGRVNMRKHSVRNTSPVG